jgi:CheY-like chemotaxis protein
MAEINWVSGNNMSGDTASGSRIKVCLVDDDADFCEIYSRSLEGDDFRVMIANDGNRGLELIRKECPDIILLDLHMPERDGFEVLQELALDTSASKIPVIVLSNNDQETSFETVGDYKAKFFLVKALTTPKEVAGVIREILSN